MTRVAERVTAWLPRRETSRGLYYPRDAMHINAALSVTVYVSIYLSVSLSVCLSTQYCVKAA